MRAAAENELSIHGRFESVDACAEATGLEAASVDFIVAAQAFHWFDPAAARVGVRAHSQAERSRRARLEPAPGHAAKPGIRRGCSKRSLRSTPQVREKERAAEHKILSFFAPTKPDRAKFENEQRLDEAGLRGRLLSSSYAPPVGHPLHDPIMRRLGEIFRAHAESGFVTIEYETIVWYGGLAGRSARSWTSRNLSRTRVVPAGDAAAAPC